MCTSWDGNALQGIIKAASISRKSIYQRLVLWDEVLVQSQRLPKDKTHPGTAWSPCSHLARDTKSTAYLRLSDHLIHPLHFDNIFAFIPRSSSSPQWTYFLIYNFFSLWVACRQHICCFTVFCCIVTASLHLVLWLLTPELY